MVFPRGDGSGPGLCYRFSHLAAGQLAPRRLDCPGAGLSTFGQSSSGWSALFPLSSAAPPGSACSAAWCTAAFVLGLHVHRKLLVSLRGRGGLFRRDPARNGAGLPTRPMASTCSGRRLGGNDNPFPSLPVRLLS